jgi:hypothetical protein
MMGRGRSLQAVLAQEKGLPQTEDETEEAPRGTESEIIIRDGASLDEQHFAEGVQHAQERRAQWRQVERAQHRDLGIVVPGSWKRASKRWQWVRRAQAFDEQIRHDVEQELILSLSHEGIYLSKAQRLEALDMLASAVMIAISRIPEKQEIMNDLKPYLACIKQMQSILKDIRKEMSTIDLSLMHRKDF